MMSRTNKLGCLISANTLIGPRAEGLAPKTTQPPMFGPRPLALRLPHLQAFSVPRGGKYNDRRGGNAQWRSIMSAQYQVVFTGQLKPGTNGEQAARDFAAVFKVPDEKLVAGYVQD